MKVARKLIVALVALMNEVFGVTGRFTLFCITIFVFNIIT